ncbi:hypothetical protein P43SY_006046 [Pythium insidiosum]|uniref:Uncharacterized protein n=1 Tax=Pythium insidiosum TaxID=114742 RepID=A0AAD5LEA7_PYTIN|nr:hypothetical protein P43SY_006046 [Pythium insidiosum]
MADTSMASSPGAAAAVSIGNYKGVMLCNRPFNGASSTLAKETRVLSTNNNSASSSTKLAFLAGLPTEPLGMNVPIHSEPPHAVKRDKKNTALSKHKKWLHDLQKERARLQDALLEDEDEKRRRRDRFVQREAKMREAVRNSRPEVGDGDGDGDANADGKADPKAASRLRRPMWALTKETADEKLGALEDAEADDLIDFANNLDIDQFLDDVEIKARVAQVEQQMAQLQSIVEYEEAEEKRSEREAQRLEERSAPLTAADLARLDRLAKSDGADPDDDARSVASTVLSECKSIRSVHSVRSVAALTKRAEAKLLAEDAPLQPRVVTIDEEQGVRLQIKTLPSNLPYIHRNPAI